jgi:hypothetical protein
MIGWMTGMALPNILRKSPPGLPTPAARSGTKC